MTPIPAEVYARWSPMWARECHPERPWWVQTHDGYARVDDSDRRVYRTTYVLDSLGGASSAWKTEAQMLTEMALIDAAHPLPAPPPMCGQVWSVGGDEVLITFSEGSTASWRYAFMGGSIVNGGTSYTVGGKPWPMDECAILVYGPSCYGANVPWGPA